MKQLMKIVLPVMNTAGVLQYMALGTITGLSSFLFMNMITRVIDQMIAGKFSVISQEYLIMFASVILLFVWSRRQLALRSVDLSLKVSWSLRKRILRRVLKANYRQLSARKDRINTAVRNDVGALTNASMSLIHFLIALVISASCFVYLASISGVLFVITLLVSMLGIAIYYFTSRANMLALDKTRKLENEFQKNLSALLNGFKEIYMDPRKGRFMYDHKICANADDSYRHDTFAVTGFVNNQIIGQVLYYLLITSILLLFSVVLDIEAGDVVRFLFALLYLLGSIETITVQFPILMRAQVAADHLVRLTDELEKANFKNRIPEGSLFKDIFEELTLADLEFRYEDGSFGIGPVNLTIRKGDIVFIYGGNGSGKTTLIHCMLGLCAPSAGEIKVNDIVVQENNYPEYKDLFAVVFNDFYLFDEILKEDFFDLERWNGYLELFELEGKVSITNKKFSTTDLSTGQRKRLALILGLMEGKPILVTDEWAADQDPYFRKKFYTDILPQLRNEGITVIAITHDDRYYAYSNKLFKMEEGRLLEESSDAYNPVSLFTATKKC